jgi:hypothetical protein
MSEVYRREDRNPNVEMAQVAVVQPKCNYHWLAIAVLVLLILYCLIHFDVLPNVFANLFGSSKASYRVSPVPRLMEGGGSNVVNYLAMFSDL